MQAQALEAELVKFSHIYSKTKGLQDDEAIKGENQNQAGYNQTD